MIPTEMSWKFPKEFWMANLMELCERAAYYGFYILLTVYLTDIVDFTDFWGNTIAGVFAGLVYFLPPFSGAISDRIGFKNGLMLAFGLLSVGYFFLGIFHSKPAVLFFLVVLMVGASFIKPLITGTVSKVSTEINRARAFSLFYWIVNIGAFSGKTVVPWIRRGLGMEYINFFSAAMSIIALILAVFLFKDIEKKEERKSFKEVFKALLKILSNGRLMTLTLIISGFWLIQSQLYASMPKYVFRMVGDTANPAWLANVNPFVVVLFVVIITQWMRKTKAVNSMMVGMLIMPLSAFSMSLGPWLETYSGTEVSFFWGLVFHPLTVMMIIGISLQALAECFISPRFLEYFSIQAPKGEEGTYLGFSHLHSFVSYIAGGILSGYLLGKYCPDPRILPEGISNVEKAVYYANAHYIWYYFSAIGILAAIALYIFKIITEYIDRKKKIVDV
ncbi:MAG: MFS transporter [Calditrichaceae bacterium]|nr:MFS transporter [Calditrichaceae bacterium]MBN2710071.1 MFS transporter [Calditrichaceae bacterium]RQV94513.1 MAG: MFS transporter [Calditrichota bacterium]